MGARLWAVFSPPEKPTWPSQGCRRTTGWPRGSTPQGSGLPELGVAMGPGFPEGVCVRAGGWLGSPTWRLPDRKSTSLWAPIPLLRAPQAPRAAAGRVLGREEGRENKSCPQGLISL